MFGAHFLLFFLLSSAFAFGQKAEFFFESPLHKFSRAKEGDQLTHNYIFKNTGDIPLLITDYKVGCVCTKVYFPLKPVHPGATDTIRVSFDTRAKSGYHDRTIAIYSNAATNPYKLRFKVFVQKRQ